MVWNHTSDFKSNSRYALVQFWNHAYDFRPRCTPLSSIAIIYIITKSMHMLWLVNQLWVIVPVNVCPPSYYIKAIGHKFLRFIGWDTTWDVGRTLKELVNHSPAACDLQFLLVFYQHPAWSISLQTCGLLLTGKYSSSIFFFSPIFFFSLICQVVAYRRLRTQDFILSQSHIPLKVVVVTCETWSLTVG